MIIKNAFDKKRDLPVENYEKIGKGSNNIDKKLENKQKVNPFFDIDNNKDRENDEMDNKDKWSFFK